MLFLLFSFCLGLSPMAKAGEYEVIPLDRATESSLKSSPLSPYVSSTHKGQEDFHKKTVRAYKKMSAICDFKKIDSLDFVYDSHFLNENAFYKKYSSISRAQLTKARQIATEVYSK